MEITSIIAMFGAAIAAMFSFCVFLWRSTLTRYEKRIDTLESREAVTLDTLAENVKAVAAAMQTMVEAFKELRIGIEHTRRERG